MKYAILERDACARIVVRLVVWCGSVEEERRW